MPPNRKCSRKQQSKIDRSAVIHIGDSAINNSDFAKNLRLQFDSSLSFDKHENNVCYNCYLHIKRLARIRHVGRGRNIRRFNACKNEK